MTARAESQRCRRPLLEVLAVELAWADGRPSHASPTTPSNNSSRRFSMLLRQCIERSSVGLAFIASMLHAHLAVAQAPPSPEQPWAIPESAIRRAAALGDTGFSVPHKQYDLAALVDLAERENPNTWQAWEVAREAAAGIGLAESAYLPQLSLQAIGGFQHTPLPMPKNLVPAGYFVSDTREVIPALALKWLLFDFGRRDAQLQAARADSFVANVAFTGAHQKLIFDVSQAYFDLGAARGKLHAAQKALSTALTTQDAAVAKQNNGLATVVAVAQAQRKPRTQTSLRPSACLLLRKSMWWIAQSYRCRPLRPTACPRRSIKLSLTGRMSLRRSAKWMRPRQLSRASGDPTIPRLNSRGRPFRILVR